jgi:dipeptidyl aminopeptidase/acylaminoacyl peptidase
MKRSMVLLALALLAAAGLPAQRRAMTFEDLIAMKVVGDPRLSPDGRRVAYTITSYSLDENRGTTRVWLAELATAPRGRSPGTWVRPQPRWSPDGRSLAFIGRARAPQIWVVALDGGEARKVSSLPTA